LIGFHTMRLRHIEVFNAVMLTGSVSGAARLVNVTQPAVSRILQHAEIQLGFSLFQRSKGRLLPTTEALALYPHIEQLFAKLDEVQRLAANLKAGGTARELRVLAVLALSYEILPRAIALFRQKHPGVAVAIEALHSPQVVSSLVLQQADVGFVFSPITHPALVQEHLAEGRMVCVAPKGMLSAELVRKREVHLTDLEMAPVIGLDIRDPVGTSLNQACREAGVTLKADISVQTYHAALALAHHGLGIALVDACTAVSADTSRVEVLALQPQIPVPINALRPAGKPGSVPMRAFVRCVQQALA
jgi:DNA-binding transcriptional LysR family regulator